MQEILQLLDESGIVGDRLLSDSEIVAIYQATTEEEALKYMLLIEDFLDSYAVPNRISDLAQAVSYLNIEAMIYKNGMLPIVNSEKSI